MRIAYRQGLISFQVDTGTPVYLEPSGTAGFVTHVVSPTPTFAAFAHGTSDYLLKFDDTVVNSWGPVTPGPTNHLYWDIDLLTANVTRGITILEPVYSEFAPIAPGNDQHWFDKNENLMKVWSTPKNKWIMRVRLFAGRVMNGNVNQILMYSATSQAGLVGPSNPGFILLDTALHPLRKASQNGEFLTDDDEARVLSTVGTSGVLVQPVNRVVPVRAAESIPRMSMVYFSADDTISLASSNPELMPTRLPVGIMIDALAGGEVGSLVQSGEVTYDQWDFTGNAGKPVYSDSFGQISLTRPPGLMAFRVGFIKNKNTLLIMVDAETNPQVYSVPTTDLIIAGQTPVVTTDVLNGLGERVVTIIVPGVTPLQSGLMTAAMLNQLNNHETRIGIAETDISSLQTSKSDVGHLHAIIDVSGLQAALDNKSDITHDHDLVYSQITHDHDLVYSQLGHLHAMGDVTGLQTALDQKSFRVHLNAISEIYAGVNRTGTFDVGTGSTLQDALDNKSDITHDHDLVYAAIVHGHAISEVTGLQTALDGKAPTVHNHAIADVVLLQGALDGKAALVHGHAIGDVSGLQATLDSKALMVHGHAISEVTGLQTALDGKAPTVHTHVIADTTGLQSALDGKAPTVHGHVAADITGGTAGYVLTSSGAGSATWETAGLAQLLIPSTTLLIE